MPRSNNELIALIPELRLRSMLAASSDQKSRNNQGVFFFDAVLEAANASTNRDQSSWWPFAPLFQAMLEGGDESHALWIAFGRHSLKGTDSKRSWAYFISDSITRRPLKSRRYRNRLAKFLLLLSFPYAYPDRAQSLLLGRADLTDHQAINGRAVLATSRSIGNDRDQIKRLDRYMTCLHISPTASQQVETNLGELTGAKDEDSIAERILELCGLNGTDAHPLHFLSAREIEESLRAPDFGSNYESRLARMTPGGTPTARGFNASSHLRLCRYFGWVHDFALDEFVEILNIPLWHRASSAGESGSLILVLRKKHRLNLLHFSASRSFSLGDDFNALIAAAAVANSEIIVNSGRSAGRLEQEQTDSQRLAHDILSLLATLQLGTASDYLNHWTHLLLSDRARFEQVRMQPLPSPGEALTAEMQRECIQVAVIHGIERLRNEASRNEAHRRHTSGTNSSVDGIRDLLDELQDSADRVATVLERILPEGMHFVDLPESIWTPYIRYFIWGAARQSIYHALRASCAGASNKERGDFYASSYKTSRENTSTEAFGFFVRNRAINRFDPKRSHDYPTLHDLNRKLQVAEPSFTDSPSTTFSWTVESIADPPSLESRIVLELDQNFFKRAILK